MSEQLLICTDLDRTLIPNGPQAESPAARKHFAKLCGHEAVTLAYVSGRHRALVEKAIAHYALPVPDFVIGDVGTTIYHVGDDHDWQRQQAWETTIGLDWSGHTHAQLKALLKDITDLRVQEAAKQNTYKLSYYLPMHSDTASLADKIQQRLTGENINARLIWSVDEPAGVGLLDVLPAHASKYHAIEALMREQGFDYHNTVFCGDSGNDIEVLASPVPAVLVGNGQPEVREQAISLAAQEGHAAQLYIAHGSFMGMNGNYSGGMLEGIAHYHPQSIAWMGFSREKVQL